MAANQRTVSPNVFPLDEVTQYNYFTELLDQGFCKIIQIVLASIIMTQQEEL